MISRRKLMTHTLGAAALAGFPLVVRGQPSGSVTGPLQRPVGLQLYTVREQAAADLASTLAAVSAIGYREVELAGLYERPAREFASLLRAHDLRATAAHYSMFALQSGLEEKIADLQTLGVGYLVCSFPGAPDVARIANAPGGPGAAIVRGELTLDEWRWNADEMNRIAETAAAAGLRCAYHNHAMEFVAYDGTVAFDELLKRTDPSLVDIELDCAWVAAGGENPADYLKKIAERTTLLHIKDVIDADAEKIETTAVGSGVIDWRAVFEAVDPAQLAHYFVEQEHFRSTPLEAIRRSFDYLTSPEMAAVGGARG